MFKWGWRLKNHKNIGFLSNTGPDPLKNHKATKPAFNVGIAFRGRVDDGPLIVVLFGSSHEQKKTKNKKKQRTKKKKKKTAVKAGPPLTKLSAVI